MSDYNKFYDTIERIYKSDKIYIHKTVLIEIYDEKEKYDFFYHKISSYVKDLQKERDKMKLSELGTKSFFLRLYTI